MLLQVPEKELDQNKVKQVRAFHCVDHMCSKSCFFMG
jgi:hypothetical protein